MSSDVGEQRALRSLAPKTVLQHFCYAPARIALPHPRSSPAVPARPSRLRESWAPRPFWPRWALWARGDQPRV